MIKKFLPIMLFVCITALTAFLRLWHLGGVPISPNWDEVAYGYNAYSILQTGKDEYGVSYPLILRSFNDYKPGLYVYAVIPSIMLFHLTPFAIRLPSAIFGILGVIGTFFLVRELLALQNQDRKRQTYVGLMTMLLMAISPWHIQFSHYAHEGNMALTFCIFGLLFFLKGLKHPVWFLVSTLFYGLSLYSYQSPRLFVPLFLLGLAFIFRKYLIKQRKRLLFPLLIGLLFLLPFFMLIVQNQSHQLVARFSMTSIFSQGKPQSLEDNSFIQLLYGYTSHFSPRWLFLTGDNDRHHAPSTGLLYLWEAPFLLIGLFRVLSSKTAFRSVVLLMLLVAPIPASLATEIPHAARTLYFLPGLPLLTALGIEKAIQWIRQYSIRKQLATAILIFSIIGFFLLQYLHLYFYQMNHEVSRNWQFGYEYAVSYAQEHRKDYKKIIIDNSLEQPYIFFLFYTRFDPKAYLAGGGTKNGENQAFDIFEFREVQWNKENHDGSNLYILSPQQEHGEALHTIRYFDNSEAFVMTE